MGTFGVELNTFALRYGHELVLICAFSFLLFSLCLTITAMPPLHEGLLSLWDNKPIKTLRQAAFVIVFYQGSRRF